MRAYEERMPKKQQRKKRKPTKKRTPSQSRKRPSAKGRKRSPAGRQRKPTQKQLTAKQARFVLEYLLDANATKAAERAGYSKRSAHVQGCNLLKNPKVAAAIAKAQAQRSERTEVTADEVLLELARIGRSDIRKVSTWDEHGRLRIVPSDQLTDAEAAAISGLKCRTTEIRRPDGTIETTTYLDLTRWDKIAALREMDKHLGVGEHIHHHVHDDVEGMTQDELIEHTRGLLKKVEKGQGDDEVAYVH